MSYPPAVHLLRDLAFRGDRTDTRTRNRIDVTPGILDEAGVQLGVLATLVDVTGAAMALASVQPDWIATADLGVHRLRPITAGIVEAICEPLRVGTGSAIIDARILDADGTLCGTGRMAFARIPGSATRADVTQVGAAPAPDGPVETGIDGGSPIVEPLAERCGFVPVGPGQLRFDKSPYVENSFGTVNGGVMAFAAEAAAVSACGGGHALDLQIHYLAQVGEGPVAVTGQVLRSGDGAALVRVRAEDRSTDRLVSISDVLVAPG